MVEHPTLEPVDWFVKRGLLQSIRQLPTVERQGEYCPLNEGHVEKA